MKLKEGLSKSSERFIMETFVHLGWRESGPVSAIDAANKQQQFLAS